MPTYTKKEIEAATNLNDALSPYFSEIAKNDNIFRKYKLEITRVMDKNRDVMQTDIVGKHFLFNKDDINRCNSAIGYSRRDTEIAYDNSPYFRQFPTLARKEPILYTVPLLLYAKELYLANKINESKFVYFSSFLREYASRVYRGWPHGVNEGRMRYTVEKRLDDRFDLKKVGTVYAVLLKTSETSYEHYMPMLAKNPTDSLLHDIMNSGISVRIVSFLKSISKEYQAAEGQYLNYENNSAISTDEDTEGTSYGIEIKSNAAVKQNLVRRAVVICNTTAVNEQYCRMAAKIGYKSTSRLYSDLLQVTIKNVIEGKRDKLAEFFDSIIGYFLYSINPITNERNMERDIKTVKFILSADRLYKSSNTKNENVIRVKKALTDFLTDCSFEYNNYKSKQQKNSLEKAVLIYFAILIQQIA